jgi:hypothetical protein
MLQESLFSVNHTNNTHISSATLTSPSIIHISTITYRSGPGAPVRVNFDFWCNSEHLIPSGHFVYLRLRPAVAGRGLFFVSIQHLACPIAGERFNISFLGVPLLAPQT